MFFKQIKNKDKRHDNFSYIIANEATGEALVIDPNFNADEIIQVAKKNRFKVKYVIATHHHWDHIAGIKEITLSFGSKVVAHKLSQIDKDIEVVDGTTLRVGEIICKVIHTAGHTTDGICLLVDNKIFTGDTLFVGECGRTDLSEGNPQEMYNSLFQKLMKLDDAIEVYPGHDYGSQPHSTIGIERKTNYTLEKRSLKEFIEFMKEP